MRRIDACVCDELTNLGDVEGNQTGEESTSESRKKTPDEEQLVAVGRLAAAHGDGSSQGRNLESQ